MDFCKFERLDIIAGWTTVFALRDFEDWSLLTLREILMVKAA